MANKIEIDTIELNKDIKKFDTTLDELKKDLDGLNREIEALNAMWDGIANSAFNIQYRSDYTSLNNMLKALREYSQDLKSARTDYDKCESVVDGMVKAINV